MVPAPEDAPRGRSPEATTDSRYTTRRGLLATAGAASVTTVTAGCAGRLPGSGPATVSTEVIEKTPRRIAWQFPRTAGDTDGIGYVAVERRKAVPTGWETPAMRFQFNATVADFSTAESHHDYVMDGFVARFRPPLAYLREYGPPEMLVASPYRDGGFRTYREGHPDERWLVLELRDAGVEGTHLYPFVLNPRQEPLPEELHCEVTLRASGPGLFGRRIQISERGTLAFGGAE